MEMTGDQVYWSVGRHEEGGSQDKLRMVRKPCVSHGERF